MGSPIQQFSSEVVLEGELEDALFAGTENLAGRAVIKVIVNFRKPADADVDWGNAPEEEWAGDLIQSISKPFLEAISD
jgi:hypothetical protein